jgi:hypothetical protein
MAITVTNETRVNLDVIDGTKRETKYSVEESDAQEMIAELEKEGKTGEVTVSQTFSVTSVSDEDPLGDFATLVPNTAEQANLINRAIVLKQQQYMRRLLVGSNFTPVDGVYDLASIIGQPSERRSATPAEKAANALSKMLGRQVTQEELAAIVAAMPAA